MRSRIEPMGKIAPWSALTANLPSITHLANYRSRSLPMNFSDESFFRPYGILNYSGCVPHAPFGPCEQGP